jgi:beta-phosphoglucomutase-like phosphatase (HAD superfamily)
VARDFEGPLAEYNALRQEVTSRLGFMHQLLALQLTVTGTIIAVSFSAPDRSDLLLVLPWSSYLLCGRYVSQEYGIDRIGEYHRRRLAHLIPGALGWEQWMIDHPRRVTNLGWRIPLFVAFPGVAVFALAWNAAAIFNAQHYSDATIARIIFWCVGLTLTALSFAAINSILQYRRKAHIVIFSLDASTRISALIFDVDGLMIDSERLERDAWQAAAGEFGRAISNAEFAAMIGMSHLTARSYLTQVWSDRPGAEEDFEKIFARKLDLASAVPIEKKPGLDSLMSWADSLLIPMAIASSTRSRLVADRLERSCVDWDSFKAIVCGDDVVEVKPAPDIYLLAARKLRVEPGCCLVLEDSDNGIRAAHAAGMIPILIPDLILRAEQPPADVIAKTYATFSSLSELEKYLRMKLWS